jgi:hypothetical protein
MRYGGGDQYQFMLRPQFLLAAMRTRPVGVDSIQSNSLSPPTSTPDSLELYFTSFFSVRITLSMFTVAARVVRGL